MGTYLGKVNQEMEGTQSYVLGSIEKCSGVFKLEKRGFRDLANHLTVLETFYCGSGTRFVWCGH